MATMADIFTEQWMNKFKNEWNNESEMVKELSNIDFNSTIAYGFDDEDNPRGVLVIEKGKAVTGSSYEEQDLNWDIRASKDNWQKWFSKPPGMMGLGIAYTARSMKFNKGDYTAMIKDPRMAGPFVKSFAVMGRV